MKLKGAAVAAGTTPKRNIIRGTGTGRSAWPDNLFKPKGGEGSCWWGRLSGEVTPFPNGKEGESELRLWPRDVEKN